MRRLAVVGLFVFAACTRSSDGAMCVTGDQKACPCLGGGQGVQVCLADGTYDQCICGEMGVPGDDLSMPLDLSVPGDDLAGIDLAGADLAWNADLAGVDLAGADFAAPLDFATPPDFTAPLDFSKPPDFSGIDLAGADLSPPLDFGGTQCSAMICSGAQICCLSNPSTGACEPAGSCDGGSPFACDGPEDCNGGKCCVTVDTNGSGGESGQSFCAPSCPNGSYSTNAGGGAHEVSIMCHGDSDCSGYFGTVPVFGSVPFNGCCHNPSTTGTYHVCVPSSFAAAEGYTCP